MSAVPPGVPHNPNASEKQRVRSKLRRFIVKRPSLQSLQEKGLIRGGAPRLQDPPHVPPRPRNRPKPTHVFSLPPKWERKKMPAYLIEPYLPVTSASVSHSPGIPVLNPGVSVGPGGPPALSPS